MALADIRDATLLTLSLALADIRDATLPTSLLALAHIGDATLPTSSLALAWWGGVGWVGVGWADNVQWHLQAYVMLRYRPGCLHLHTYRWCYATDLVSCTCTHRWCYATDLVSCTCMMGWGGVGWGGLITFNGTCRHTWCYATDLVSWCVLHLQTYVMLRYRPGCLHLHT